MTELITTEALTVLFQVIMIDLMLAGDNAIVIGLAAEREGHSSNAGRQF
jgi:predicted tellurium resistance membrane protein TerC